MTELVTKRHWFTTRALEAGNIELARGANVMVVLFIEGGLYVVRLMVDGGIYGDCTHRVLENARYQFAKRCREHKARRIVPHA